MLYASGILIASVTPQNLERGVLWFSENHVAIKKALVINPWWRDNGLFIENNLSLKPSVFTRRLADFGYERTQTIRGRGLFAVRGGIIELWPINTEKPYLIEFTGNTITAISERPESEEKVIPRISTRSIDTLQRGNYIVHVDHGIGVYRGITNAVTTQHARSNAENYYIIEYAPPAPGKKPDRLYVPTDQKKRLSPYVGLETPRIHRLGGTLWHTTKRKVQKEAEKLAGELIRIYAKRAQTTREPHCGDLILEEELRRTFPFTETDDQRTAEKEIMRDLEKPQPMDRVLAGDVGFGKTEIAIRAALRVITSGNQVAVLSPTTVLAAQHEKTFKERLADLPITVKMLSRLTSSRDEKRTLKELADGTADCVIGTHRLLSGDITFKNLGLIIIDEEQRFGVKQKEHFKSLRAHVDILSLSATPIPRTLSLALARLRDLSIIETPPPERLPIKTYILPYTKKTITRALTRELERNGQIYFLHNRIETIDTVRSKLKKSLRTSGYKRQTKIGIIHGRMPEKEMIRTMNAFRKKEIDILLATTIIENGLDISSVNTLVVDDVTRLGLAEAHQLRGRIGRGATQAHAYFLYKPRHVTEKATERLDALKEYSELGAGYRIALRDLDIRGAGNILGREQSGAINKVGLNLYYQILAEAIEHSKHTTNDYSMEKHTH
jgi:transcription-repair coupling factor (superfamily II helicase)